MAEGNRIWAGTGREDTWMMYHDALSVWWEKESQDYLKSLPCPIEGNPNRTWYDRQCLENIFPLIKSRLVIRGRTVCMRLLQAHTHLQSSNFLCFLKIRLIPKI
jgi:hypothetical protein